MKYSLIALAAAFAYKLLTNVCNYYRISYYKELYMQSFSKDSQVNILEYKSAILQLFKAAGVSDSLVSYVEPAGYGMLTTGNASAFQNISSNRSDVVSAIMRSFYEAHGTFQRRIMEAFSPLYWINCILFLPKSLFCYLGIKDDSLLIKVFQLLYWIASPVLLIFREDIYQYLSSLISKLQ